MEVRCRCCSPRNNGRKGLNLNGMVDVGSISHGPNTGNVIKLVCKWQSSGKYCQIIYIPATWEVQYLSPTAPSPHNQVHELCLTRRGETWNLPQAPISLVPRVSEALSLSVCYSTFLRNVIVWTLSKWYTFTIWQRSLNSFCKKKGKSSRGIYVSVSRVAWALPRNMTRVFCLQLKHRDVSHNPFTSNSFISSLSHWLFRVWWFSSSVSHKWITLQNIPSWWFPNVYPIIFFWFSGFLYIRNPVGVIMPNAFLKKWKNRGPVVPCSSLVCVCFEEGIRQEANWVGEFVWKVISFCSNLGFM